MLTCLIFFSFAVVALFSPKGAILTHGNIIAACAGMEERATPEEKSEDEVFFSYLPLAHIYERICQANVIAVGGAIGFSQVRPSAHADTAGAALHCCRCRMR